MSQYKVHQYYEYRSTMTIEAESAGEAAMKAQDIIDKTPSLLCRSHGYGGM